MKQDLVKCSNCSIPQDEVSLALLCSGHEYPEIVGISELVASCLNLGRIVNKVLGIFITRYCALSHLLAEIITSGMFEPT